MEKIAHLGRIHTHERMKFQQENNLWIPPQHLTSPPEHLKFRAFHINFDHVNPILPEFLQETVKRPGLDSDNSSLPLRLILKQRVVIASASQVERGLAIAVA